MVRYRFRAVGALLVPLLGLLGACGGSEGHNAQDVSFAQTMIPHHAQAIEMADMASSRATASAVRELAARIKAAQQPEIGQMRAWLSGWGEAVPSGGMGAGDQGAGDHGGGMMMSEQDMAALGGASGLAFDRMFLTMMVAHHNGAIEAAKQEVDKGSSGPAKKLAVSIRDSQQDEVTEMDAILGGLPAA